MSFVSHIQPSFTAGEISRRLRSRIDLNIYDIAVERMEGFAPLPEGGIEAMPGLIRVASAPGPCRLIPFDYSTTQGHVIEATAAQFRIYTNDVLIESGGEPVTVAHPYSFDEVKQLSHVQSFDVLYLFHRDQPLREFARTAAASFEINAVELENGPFEKQNSDKSVTVRASGGTGNVTLTASQGIFTADDVTGLFEMETEDLSDIPSWEPGIKVDTNERLTWGGRVYRVVDGFHRFSGSLAPEHTEGIEWDGVGDEDANDDVSGVQLEYLYDRFGHVRITGYTSPTQVSATVLRRLPENVVGGSNNTHKWSFGSFSPRRGYPHAGMIWGERLILAKDSTLYGSVVGDFRDHKKRNEEGEISTDMAFVVTLADANPIELLIATDRPLAITSGSCYALQPTNQAQGLGPGNIHAVRQHSTGAARATPAEINGRIVYIDRSRRHVIEADYDVAHDRQEPIDLSRYSRHIGLAHFAELTEVRTPNRQIWTVMHDGTMAMSAYIPEEKVLGWCRRTLAPGLAARSLCSITDPAGEVSQLWVAVQDSAGWHVCRMARWRDDSEWNATPVMSDLAVEYNGAAAASFGPFSHFANRTIEVVSEGRAWRNIVCDASGNFTLPESVTEFTAGLAFPASVQLLPLEAGGDTGPARGKKRKVARAMIEILDSLGLRWRVDGGEWRDMWATEGGQVPSDPRSPQSGFVMMENSGDWQRLDSVEIERVAPFQSTILAVHRHATVEQR